MPLKATLETLDGLDTALHAFYVKSEDGKSFRLDADGVEDVTGLKSALKKQTDSAAKNAEEVRRLNEQFKGIDADQVRKIMSRVDGDDEAKLIADGKIDVVIEKRTEKLRKGLEDQVKAAATKAEQAEAKAKKYSQRVLDDQIRDAATKAGVHPAAIDDALFRGRSMFSLDEDGRAVQLGDDGIPVLSKDGKSPFAPTEWLAGMKETAPHWFPAAASGGGANGSRGGHAPGIDLSHLTPQARMSADRKRRGVV